MISAARRTSSSAPIAAAVRAGYAPTLGLTVTVAFAAFLILMSALLLVVHPPSGLGAFTGLVNQQRQSAKTALYVAAFALVLPAALVLVPRVADAIAGGPNAAGLAALAGVLAGGLAGLLVVLRLSAHLPWGDGLGPVLAGVGLWSVAAGAALRRAASGRPWPGLLRVGRATGRVWTGVGALAVVDLLCVTSPGSLHVVPLAAGALACLAIGMLPRPRVRMGGPRRAAAGRALDALGPIVLAFAVVNVVVFHATGRLPNIYVPPGVIQNQQDYLLGPVNQLLGGGALLVNAPVSQYGVGMIYFLAGWFDLTPIGYGTLGLLDGLLTASFYIGGYAVLRLAGVGRGLAVAALAAALVGLVYGLHYPVGALPETGPLRFGLPMALILARVGAARAPHRRALAALPAVVVGIAAIWAFEAFVYTAVALAGLLAAEVWLRAPGDRRAWLLGQVGGALAACAIAHLLLAVGTLAGTGRLPDWGHYAAYLHSFLLGGRAGLISYGFARWSPGLAVGAAVLASAAGLLLLARRLPAVASCQPRAFLALAGLTAYTVALLSYTDNRSSTYLLPYVTLPLVLAAALWLTVAWRARPAAPRPARRGAGVFAVAVAALVVSAAWPAIGGNFSESALAHAYPGGGLGAAVRRLWHPPAIDPRAPVGVRLLDRYVPGRRALIVLPTVPDLAVEILMRSRRTSPMFIGDPIDDGFVPSVWLPKLRREVAALRPGTRLLIDSGTLRVLADLRAHPAVDPTRTPLDYGDQEDEWLLRAIDRRFAIRPIVRARDGLMIARLVRRPASPR